MSQQHASRTSHTIKHVFSDLCVCYKGSGGGGHQKWLQLKTEVSGQRVTGLNPAPGNLFRGQVCLLKREAEFKCWGLRVPRFSIQEINYQVGLIAVCIYHIPRGRSGRKSSSFSLLSFWNSFNCENT